MITIEGLIEIIIRDLRSSRDFTSQDELDMAVEALGLALLPYKKVKEKAVEYKREMGGEVRGCSAILKSGPAKGEECGRILKGDGDMCSIHSRLKKVAVETDAVQLPPQQTVQPPPAVVPESQKIHTVDKDDLVIKPNRWKNFVYPGTALILDKDKKVTAREGITGEWLPLTGDDIATCKRLKLGYKIVDLEFDGEIG